MAIYKYCRSDSPSIQGILKDCTLFFRRLHEFNDPYESKPWIIGSKADREYIARLNSRVLEDFFSSHKFRSMSPAGQKTDEMRLRRMGPPSVRQTRDLIEDLLNSEFAVLCLSRNPSSVLMWSHYSNGHRGYVVELDEADHLFSGGESDPDKSLNLKRMGTLFDVKYSNHREVVRISDLDHSTLFGLKAAEWQYESECRVVRFQRSLESHEGTLRGRFQPSSIRRVMVGNSISAEALEEIKAVLRNHRRNGINIPLERMNVSESQFAMDTPTRIGFS